MLRYSLTNDQGTGTVQQSLLKKESKKSRFKRLKKYKWGVGLEHEMQLFHYPSVSNKNDKNNKKIDSFIMFNSKPYISELVAGNRIGSTDKEFIATVPYELTGRKCNGKVVLEKIPIEMPEFVTDRPFNSLEDKRSIETYCDNMIHRENRFIGLLDKNAKVRKLTDKYGELWQFPYGICDYFKINNSDKPADSYHFKKDRKGNDKLYTDYLGSYHITLTLPFTDKIPLGKFIKMHQNFANQIQWIEPLLISAFFSCDQKAIGSSEERIKGSYRVLRIGWGNFAGSDIRKFSKGIGRYANIKPYWRKGLNFYNMKLTNYCEKIAPELKKKEHGAVSSFSSNFRTFGSTDPDRPWHRESGIGMTKPNGLELRIFDHFASEYLVELCKLVVYIAENSRIHKSTKYVYKNKYWIKSMQNIILNGWHATVEEEYVNALRKQLGLKISTKSRMAYDVLFEINNELYKKNKNGDWVYMMMDKNTPIKLPHVNRESWDMAFMIKMHREEKLLKSFNEFIFALPLKVKMNTKKFEEIYFKYFDEKHWKRDCINIIYFLEYIHLADLIHKVDGSISSIEIKKHHTISNFNKEMEEYWFASKHGEYEKYVEIVSKMHKI